MLNLGGKKELLFNPGQTIPMDTHVIFREMTFNGKMTQGVVVMFTWPETWMEMSCATGLQVVD